MRPLNKILALLPLLILFFPACKGEHSELTEFLEEYTEIAESCTKELNNANNAKEVAKAANDCTPKLELWAVKQAVIKDKYSSKQDIPKDEDFEETAKKADKARGKFKKAVQAKARFVREPYAADALRRLAHVAD